MGADGKEYSTVLVDKEHLQLLSEARDLITRKGVDNMNPKFAEYAYKKVSKQRVISLSRTAVLALSALALMYVLEKENER